MLNFVLRHSKQLSELAQALALISAAVFFLWKLVAGYLFCNLSLQIGLTRIPKYSGKDHLITEIKLLKGDRSSLLLKSIRIIVRTGTVVHETPLNSPFIPGETRMIRLTPGESTQFSHICEVDSDSVCHVEVSVDGKPLWFTTGHWKASAHSARETVNA